MAGGGKTQTSTSSVQIPPEVMARYNAINTRAENTANTPFQAYSQNANDFVAPLTGTQRQAIGQIADASTMAQPWFNMAGGATMAGMGPANLGELDTQKYMNPYTQYVVQNTADILGQQNQQAMSGALGTAIGAGAGFGDRSGIAAANLARQQQMGLGSTIGNLLNQGYQQAQGVAQQQQSADLAARQANLARLLQGGQSLGQLGAGAQGSALAGAQALFGAGTQEQQTEQAGKSALYNQYQQMRAYPFQVAQFLANIGMGTGALSGSTTTETKPAGFFSGFKEGGKVIEGSYRRGGLIPESMGGHVAPQHMGEGYADGGAPADYSTMIMQQLFGGASPDAGAYGMGKMGLGAAGYVPQANLPVGQLNAPKISESAPQTSISDIVDTASSLGEDAGKVGDWWEKNKPRPDLNIDKDADSLSGQIYRANGGRAGLAAGGMPYDPQNTGYVPDNTPQKSPELNPAKISSGGQESGLGKVADMAKLAMMFMPMATGGVAGRHGYADGGNPFASDAALIELARKKKEQDALRQPAGMTSEMLSASDYSVPERLAKNMPVSPAEMQDLYNQQAQAPALPGLVPSASTDEFRTVAAKRPPNIDASGFQNTVSGIGDVFRAGLIGTGNALTGVNLAGEVMSALEAQGLPTRKPATGWNNYFLSPSEIEKRDRALAVTDPILDWYREHADTFQGRPELMSEMLKDPIAYYNTHKDIAATGPASTGSVSYMGGLSAPDASNSAFLSPEYSFRVAPTLSGKTLGDAVATPPSVAPAVTTPAASGDGLFLGSAKAAEPAAPAATEEAAAGLYLNAPAQTGASSGLVPPVPRAREDRPNIAPEEKRSLTPTAAGTAELGPTREKYQGDDFFGEYIIPRESAGRHFDKNGNPLTSSAGAVGISQMLPSTGPEAAKLAGLEWDENRFYNDPKYNEKLGRAYFNSLLDRYNGDTTLASAAYNAGMGRVDKAIARAREDGGNWTDYLPGETRKYISGMPGGTVEPGPTTADGGGEPSRGEPSRGGLGGAGDFWSQAFGSDVGPGNIVLPFLAGLGKMAGSQSRFLGTAILEGIGGGAEAYMNRQKQLADIAGTKATAFSNISTALSNMLVKDASGNVFVPLQGGGYQLMWDFLDNPKGPSLLGQQADRLLRELNAGGPSGTAQLQEIIKTIPSAVEGGAGAPAQLPSQSPVSAEVSNIVWSPNSDLAIADDKAMARSQGRQAYLEQSMNKFATVQALAENAVTNAQDMNTQIYTVADVLANPPPAQPGPAGQWRSWVDSNIKFLANIAGIDVSSLGDMSDQAAILNKLAAQAGGRMTPEGQNALQALQTYINLNPNMDMPPEAMKTITVSLMQANQQALERNAYYRNYMRRSGGFNMGADQAFLSEIGRLHQQEHEQLMTIFNDPDLVKNLTSGISFEEAQKLIDHALGAENASRVLARFFAPGAY